MESCPPVIRNKISTIEPPWMRTSDLIAAFDWTCTPPHLIVDCLERLTRSPWIRAANLGPTTDSEAPVSSKTVVGWPPMTKEADEE